MLTVKLILERLDKEGRLLERREQLSKSFVQNFISLLYIAHAQIQSGAPYSMTDIDGNPRDIDSQGSDLSNRWAKANLKIGSSPGSSGVYCFPGMSGCKTHEVTIEGQKIGIQVGTGTNVVTPTDTALQTRIAHGRAGTELEYGGCELVGIVFSDPNGEFTIRRYFTNHSGGGITVEEVGIHTVGGNYGDRAAWAFLIARDLTGGVAVANTEILRVTYVPQITV